MARYFLRHLAGTAVLCLALGTTAQAAPLEYGFVSLGSAVERRSGVDVPASQRLFPTDLTVAGTFTYSTEAAYFKGERPGPMGLLPWYGDFSLQLDLGGTPFSSNAFSAVIGDRLCAADPPTPDLPPIAGLDCLPLMIYVGSNPPAPLLGPERSDGEGRRFGLVNVVLVWIEGADGSGAFLNGIDVPATLPPAGTGAPMLVLEFRELDAPAGAWPVQHTVRFDAIKVAVVPVPASGWLLATAIAVMMRRRRSAHTCAP